MYQQAVNLHYLNQHSHGPIQTHDRCIRKGGSTNTNPTCSLNNRRHKHDSAAQVDNSTPPINSPHSSVAPCQKTNKSIRQRRTHRRTHTMEATKNLWTKPSSNAPIARIFYIYRTTQCLSATHAAEQYAVSALSIYEQ